MGHRVDGYPAGGQTSESLAQVSSESVLTALAQGFADAVQPLAGALSSSADLGQLLSSVGWPAPSDINVALVAEALGPVPNDLRALAAAGDALKNDGGADVAVALADAVNAIGDLTTHLRGLSGQAADPAWPSPLNTSEFWGRFPSEILESLLYEGLRAGMPKAFALFRLLGALREDIVSPSDGGTAYIHRTVDWGALVTALRNPGEVAASIYGWGGEFAARYLIEGLSEIIDALHLPGGVMTPPDRARGAVLRPRRRYPREPA